MTPVVRFDNVSIVFGDQPKAALPLIDRGATREEIAAQTGQILGVADCTLDVHEGEIVVLMGLSGSGKSTLLRAANGLNPVVRGRTFVSMGENAPGRTDDYEDPATASRRRLRRLRQKRVAMVFQQFGLLPWRTVRQNAGLGLELAGVGKAERARRVDEQLALVGLSDRADSLVGELSGGMQQRVGLARAFATQAPILLMDEPFSALDPLIRDKLQDDLLMLQERLRKTILFVSHDFDEAVKLGNRIALMEGGRIVQCGTAAEIVTRPATDYVREFVAHMNPLTALSAGDLARPVPEASPVASMTVAATAPLREVLPMLHEAGGPVAVVRDGSLIGSVAMADVVEALRPKPSD